MLRMSMDDFERVVEEALEELPASLRREMENIVVVVEDEPSDAQLRAVGLDPEYDTILGLYEGTPLTEREISPVRWRPSRPDLDLPSPRSSRSAPTAASCFARSA